MAKAAKSNSTKPTAVALIEAAERIFADQGVENASLRQIATAAGSANSFAVQYHFGSREALVDAIFEHRLVEFEGRRAEMLRAIEPFERGDVRRLLEVMCRPLFDQRDAQGRHSYANFLSSLYRTSMGLERRLNVSHKAPVMGLVGDRLRESLPELDNREFAQRSLLGFRMMLDAILCVDVGTGHFEDEAEALDEVLTLLEALFRARARRTLSVT
jgi:AcrR family transcriptional regulator